MIYLTSGPKGWTVILDGQVLARDVSLNSALSLLHNYDVE